MGAERSEEKRNKTIKNGCLSLEAVEKPLPHSVQTYPFPLWELSHSSKKKYEVMSKETLENLSTHKVYSNQFWLNLQHSQRRSKWLKVCNLFRKCNFGRSEEKLHCADMFPQSGCIGGPRRMIWKVYFWAITCVDSRGLILPYKRGGLQILFLAWLSLLPKDFNFLIFRQYILKVWMKSWIENGTYVY